MKKLVPATRSRIRRMHAGIRTAKAMSPMTEVMNHAHVAKGRRASDMPRVRRSSVVAMKLSEPSSCATQNNPFDTAHSDCPTPCPGPASLPTALNGAYDVHPDKGGPSPTKNTEIRQRNARRGTQ